MPLRLHALVQANLGEPNKNEALAVDARQELDLKVGVAFTRYQTRYFQVCRNNSLFPVAVSCGLSQNTPLSGMAKVNTLCHIVLCLLGNCAHLRTSNAISFNALASHVREEVGQAACGVQDAQPRRLFAVLSGLAVA